MPRARFWLVMLVLVCVDVAPVLTQNSAKPITRSAAATAATAAQQHDAKLADVASPDAILAAVYDVISGPAGKERDWDRMRSLFYPGAQLIRTVVNKEGRLSAGFFTVQGYVDRAGNYFKTNGFFEREIARRSDHWGSIMEVFSTYESRHDAKDAAPFARGINSFQLFFDGTRWWIMTIYWAEETPQNPLPPEFLSTAH